MKNPVLIGAIIVAFAIAVAGLFHWAPIYLTPLGLALLAAAIFITKPKVR